MLSIDEIKKPVAVEIDVFESKFKASMHSSVPLLDRIT
ncbi:MAG: polyprenyl synthetase family protein, partial [Sphingobacteriaceae bacterium]